MLLSAEVLEADHSHIDLSFQRSHDWPVSQYDQDMRAQTFCIGDPESGAMVMLATMSVKPGDEAKFPPIIHMHRSDSFRTILRGDFFVGRKIYENGVARLQESGTYYGPEQPGTSSIAQAGNIWSLLVFGDKRGYRVHPADKKYLPAVRAGDEAMADMYQRLGVSAVLPEKSTGEPNIRTCPTRPLRAGHADIDFCDAGGWPSLGDARATVMALGSEVSGPLVLALSAAPGGTALPSLRWDTEVLFSVAAGSMAAGDASYAVGDLRLQLGGEDSEPILAGPDGLNCYIVIGDRRALPGSAGYEAAAGWLSDLRGLCRPLFAAADTAAMTV